MKTALGGMFNRRERWGFSRTGWIGLILAVVLASTVFSLRIHPFLALTKKVESDILVVEGWIHDFAVQEAVKEFKAGSYRRAFATGGPVPGSGGYINDFNTSASVCADLLKKHGLPVDLVHMVPSRVVDRNRTFGAAVALRNWMTQNHAQIRSFNVITEDAHARRTLLLFRKAFAGHNVQIGVISVASPDYNPRRWWRYSEGVREILGETVAYVYARFLFWPDAPELQGHPARPSAADARRSIK